VKHIKTPVIQGDYFECDIFDSNEQWVATCKGETPLAEQRAAELVQIINLHEEMVAALKPLAAIAAELPKGEDWPDDRMVFGFNLVNITVGEIRQAASIVAKLKGEQ